MRWDTITAIQRSLGQLAFTADDVEAMRAKYHTWDIPARIEEERQFIDLRLADASDRLERLTDFLLDGTLDREAYNRRRGTLQLEIAGLKEDIQDIEKNAVSKEDIEKFFELMKSLAELYDSAKPPVKRGIVENCFSNRTWTGSHVELEPSDRLVRAKTDLLAPSGGGTRDTFRTFIAIFDKSDDETQTSEVA